MEYRVFIGEDDEGQRYYAEVKYKDKRLSICGEVYLPYKKDWGSFGQCSEDFREITKFAKGWDRTRLNKFLKIWEQWHLNDMNAGCVHQDEWDLDKKVELTHFGFGAAFMRLRNAAKEGKLPIEKYKNLQKITQDVYEYTVNIQHKNYIDEKAQDLLNRDLIQIKRKETKPAIHVWEKEHPEGMLTKKCEVCGHRYGSSWLFREVPEDVIGFLYQIEEENTNE
jgi:hypothetical protein